MKRKQKIIIGTFMTIIACITIPLAFKYYSNLQQKADLEALEKQMNFQLDNQKKILEKEYVRKLHKLEKNSNKKDIEEVRITESLKNVLLKYYESNKDREALIHSVDGNGSITRLTFNVDRSREEKVSPIRDNEAKIANNYSINHINSRVQDNDNLVEKNDIVFTICSEEKDKFDINKSKLALDYFNLMLGRELTEKDKIALNIQANMDLKELSSIEDINTYIYNGESLKIGDFVFNCSKSKDEENDLMIITYKINSHSIIKNKAD